VAGALAVAWLADRAVVHAVPRHAEEGLGVWLAGIATSVAVGWGASRLPVAAGKVPPALPLALGSLLGVWVGVPETSAAILVAGVLGGVTGVVIARGVGLSRPGAVVAAVAPVGAACVGAAGNAHALVGGLLCSATFVVLGLGPRLRAVSVRALAAGSGVHLLGALVAGRQIGVHRDWQAAPAWIALVAGLAATAAWLLRAGQPDGEP